ncbi:hemin receptor [Roseococcus sp. SYP-B2431]|uniref:globin family protein n=1 Tax=Roseococcus sp. SYP-B2431 TaxID=2496640 RepID=UPI00103924CB|nr:globin family protein [Roseococcus sp. SYP-B2431]TCI00019.1 hemin receptor [Roseococcus sp. SYP-B2431]
MDAHRIELVRASFPKVAAIAPQAARLFYGRLFDLDPSVERLFDPARMTSQGAKLMTALGFVVAHLDRPERLLPVARDLAVRHLSYGVRREHYIPVGEALLWTLEKGLGDGFTPELRAAWAEAYVTLAAAMTDAAYVEMAA